MKRTVIAIVLAAPAILAAAEPPQGTSLPKSACTSEFVDGMTEFTCPLQPRATARYRFKADFLRVHDDTQVTMIPLLNEQPLTCAEGSKIQFLGDELGDASLECRFALPANAGTKPVLKVRMKWSHAEHAGVELLIE